MSQTSKAGGPGYCFKCQRTVPNVSLHRELCGTVSPEEARILDALFPVTIYFGTRKDADDFIAIVKESNPNLAVR